MVAKPKWVLPKKDRENWEQMVHAASKRIYEESYTSDDVTILNISKQLSLVERQLRETNSIAALLQKAKKGEL